ncbi:30S ribosomal protein S1 [bacterium]|nr:30S ribosomal protein S1 [bacterium]
MVDEEKNTKNEMTGEETPEKPMEGGEVNQEEEKESVQEKSQAVVSSDEVLTDEENEYSEEEYQRFVDLYSRTLIDIEEGQIVQGRVLAITDKDVVVDIGFKSEGTVPKEEFQDIGSVKVGDSVDVFLDTLEDADGQLQLSKRKADFMKLWDQVVDVYNENSTIEGICMRRIKGGIVVDLNGVDAFLPGSQIDVKPVRDFDALIGQKYTFRIVKVNRMRKNIVVSRRALLEESMAEQREEILQNLEKGQVREGTVKNITDFGVFVDLGGVDGLLHINDISWGRVNHPSDVVSLDQKIKVAVLDFNDAKDRISLGMKQLTPHPWEGIQEKYPESSVVTGKVVSIADYGAFIELENGVEGLVHVSEMSWTRNIVHPSKILNVGDKIEVKVLNVDKDRKRISLGIKQLTPDPWEGIEEKYPVGSRHKGRIRNMTNFGAFIEMEDGIDGLIHISDLSWTKKIKHPSEVLKKNDEIEIVVLDMNKEERRLSLGYKQISVDPWPAFEEAYKVGTNSPAKIVRFIEKGLVVELPLGLEGFVPLSQMPESSMTQVAQNLKEGEDVEFQIIEFDKDNKRVILSRKKLLDHEKRKQEADEKTEVDAYIGNKHEAPTLGEIVGDDAEVAKQKTAKKKSASKSKKEAKEKEAEKEEAPKPKAKKTTKKKPEEKEKKSSEKKGEKKAEDEPKKAAKKSKAKKEESSDKKTEKSVKEKAKEKEKSNKKE